MPGAKVWTYIRTRSRAARASSPEGRVDQEVRSFATTIDGPTALAEWLASNGCTHVAMEATGVYWKPVAVLEGRFELVL